MGLDGAWLTGMVLGMDAILLILAALLQLLVLFYVSQVAAAAKAALKELKGQSELMQKLVWQGQKARAREEQKIQREFFEGDAG